MQDSLQHEVTAGNREESIDYQHESRVLQHEDLRSLGNSHPFWCGSILDLDGVRRPDGECLNLRDSDSRFPNSRFDVLLQIYVRNGGGRRRLV